MAVCDQVTSSEAEKNALQAQVEDITTRLQDIRVYVADLEEENVSNIYQVLLNLSCFILVSTDIVHGLCLLQFSEMVDKGHITAWPSFVM